MRRIETPEQLLVNPYVVAAIVFMVFYYGVIWQAVDVSPLAEALGRSPQLAEFLEAVFMGTTGLLAGFVLAMMVIRAGSLIQRRRTRTRQPGETL